MAAAPPVCRHHWLIETPAGPLVWGVCKRCGDARRFPASFTEDEGGPAQVGLAAHRPAPFVVVASRQLSGAMEG